MLRVCAVQLQDIVAKAKAYDPYSWIYMRETKHDGAETELLAVAVERYDENRQKARLLWPHGCDYCVVDAHDEGQLRELASSEGVSVVKGDVLEIDELEVLSSDV